MHLADRLLRSACPGRVAAGTGNDRRTAQPAAARRANRFRGGIPGARVRRMVRYFCSSADSRRTVETLSSVLRIALQTKEVRAGLANQSVDAAGNTPADFARQVKADFDRW